MIKQSTFTAPLRLFRPHATVPPKADHTLVAEIRNTVTQLSNLPDSALGQRIVDLRNVVENGTGVTDDGILVPAFALTFEAARRVLAIELYDVQLLSGLALSRRAIVEMQTGEGKTFTTLLPATLLALTGEGVHVMTVNAYLAQRDFESLAPVYRLLELSVGQIDAESDPTAKRTAYACDITFGPGYEFGFDYLRDQTALISRRKPRLGESLRDRFHGCSPDEPKPMQRGHAVAIVDEADSVMLDEATTPLILASGGDEPAANAHVYLAALQMADTLEIDRHFVVDEAAATFRLTEQGIKHVAADRNKNPRRGLDRPWQIYVEQALRAQRHFRRDVHYVVQDDEVQIVDQNTGRIFADRTWSEGLHQAVLAKEGLTITTETKSIARITRQRYLRLYEHLGGMTGTAQGSERELRNVYGLGVVVIPPNRPCRRTTLPMRIFSDRATKEQAIVAEIDRIHHTGQPVLVGTAEIETSERLARLLDERGIGHQILNGMQDADEAMIVAAAGQRGAVTIATNMAGRGTDIKLGEGVAELNGLHVITTEPQELTRVDRQLVGRAARQGDPGSCQLFASPDDHLFLRYAPELANRMTKTADQEGEIQDTSDLARRIRKVQHQVEGIQARQRSQMFAHDDWLESVLAELIGTK